eukprot:Colp12_sorted_trinity150504_noHs@12769
MLGRFVRNLKGNVLVQARRSYSAAVAVETEEAVNVSKFDVTQFCPKERDIKGRDVAASNPCRTFDDGRREYFDKPYWLPSVTSILASQRPPSDPLLIANWRVTKIRRLEKEGANGKLKDLHERRIRINTHIKKFLANIMEKAGHAHYDELFDLYANTAVVSTDKGLWKTLKPVLKNISVLYSADAPAVHRGLGYAGSPELVGMYKDKMSVISFKHAVAPHLEKEVSDPMQLVAYAGAINNDSRWPFTVTNVVQVIMSGQGSRVLVSNRNECEAVYQQWVQVVRKSQERKKESL